ncbi:MAG: sigma-70 family RNA polymerase sigma factor [Ruminococcus sp.]|nr:sigma-70 family RNA polymerase sigma factor [Ruminococcus sp.]
MAAGNNGGDRLESMYAAGQDKPDSLSACTDSELAEKYKSAEQSAPYASELICRYFPFIKMKAARISRMSGNNSSCDDFVEEGLLGFMNGVRGYDPNKGTEFSAYVHACIVNRMRTAAARLRVQNSEEIISEEEQGEDRITPENIFMGRELMQDISEELTDLEYKAFRLYYKGLSGSEIGGALGIPAKSADNAVQRARRKLREMLRER